MLLSSPARSGVYELAAALDVPHHQVAREIYRAAVDLNRLEKLKGSWRDPVKILGSPNLAALMHVCHARRNRATDPRRQVRIEKILRRVAQAYELARSRAWIEDFIGPLPESSREAQDADR